MEILLFINEFFDYLENKIILEELSQEDKKKLNEIYIKISNEWKRWKKSKFIGTIEGREENVKSLIKNLMSKAAELKPSIEKLKSLTKEGATDTEKEELKIWDYCEKMLTDLQNKMAVSNNELKKHTIINNNGDKLVQNPNWTTTCLNSVKTNYFNY
jgi:hypothetical protein